MIELCKQNEQQAILVQPIYRVCLSFLQSNSLCSVFLFFAVDADEIRRLGKRFRKLDLDNSGALSVEEFMSLPELQQNPLVQRVIDIFDSDGNGEVDFKGKNKNNCKSTCLQDLRKATVDLNMVQLICLIFILR